MYACGLLGQVESIDGGHETYFSDLYVGRVFTSKTCTFSVGTERTSLI